MDKKNIPTQFSLQILQQYIELTAILQGKSPTEIKVSNQVLNWYREQRIAIAKNFNMGTIKNEDKDLSFMGVKIK